MLNALQLMLLSLESILGVSDLELQLAEGEFIPQLLHLQELLAQLNALVQ